MSRRSSTAALSPDMIRQISIELFGSINKSKWNEAQEFLKTKSKSKVIPRDFKLSMMDLIESEEAYNSDLDKSLIPDTRKVFMMSRKKDLESSYKQNQQRFANIPDYEFLSDFCECRIHLAKLYVQLYQNSAGKPNIATDFTQIYELFTETKKSSGFNNIWKKHADRHSDFKIVFENIKIEIDTLEYILQAAKDISALHLISAQVALKQAQYNLKEWRDSVQPANVAKTGFFGDRNCRILNSHEWLTRLHSHLLAKFCLFFYSAFALTKKIGGKNQAEKEFQSVASKTVFDFHGRSMELMETNGAKAVYLVRNHMPNPKEHYSSTSRYVFKPFIEDVVRLDAERNRVGIVSAYLSKAEQSSRAQSPAELENIKLTLLHKLDDDKSRHSSKTNSKESETRKSKATYEEVEEEIVPYFPPKEEKSYHLAQVEFTYYIIISFDKRQELDEHIRQFFCDFRKHIRLHHVFRKLVRE